MIGIRYDVFTGRIRGYYHAHSAEMLQAQIAGDAAVAMLVDVDPEHPVFSNTAAWRVALPDRALAAKTVVQISADKPTFTADGADDCRVRLAPSPGLDLLVNGQVVSVVAGDHLVVTSDVPRRFRIELEDMAHYAAPITIEAI